MGMVARMDPATERKNAAAETRRKAAHDALTVASLIEEWRVIHLASKRPAYTAEAVRALRTAFRRQLETEASIRSLPSMIEVQA